jgi:hypothetical protein
MCWNKLKIFFSRTYYIVYSTWNSIILSSKKNLIIIKTKNYLVPMYKLGFHWILKYVWTIKKYKFKIKTYICNIFHKSQNYILNRDVCFTNYQVRFHPINSIIYK